LEPIATEMMPRIQDESCIISGVTRDEEKWRHCVQETNNALSFAVGAMYVRETFHGNSKASVSNVLFSVVTHSVVSCKLAYRANWATGFVK